jgi:alkyldihydroxyacetonephosphate synthase
MRRWNGWGDAGVVAEVPAGALDFLRKQIGPGEVVADARLEDVSAGVGPSRLPEHPMVDASAQMRVLHARGQSLPDWIALRSGRVGRVPDGVAFPESGDDVRELLALGRRWGAVVIPYGGGTSVVGHLAVPEGDEPVLVVSLERMRRMTALDEKSRLATFAAGVAGPDLEAQLRAHGYTLGHFPQSFEYSTLGGWVVTRSSGQQSLRYGRIEQLFAGGRVETPRGALDVPAFPASGAGTDVRELVLGSEGRIGILTEATVRVRPVAEHETFVGWVFPRWEQAETAVRDLVNAGLSLSMLRLANAAETSTTMRLAGGGTAHALLERYLSLRGMGKDRCLLIAGITGSAAACRATLSAARALCKARGGAFFGTSIGERWNKNRFRSVYLRNAMWDAGYAIDTLETAVPWPRVRPTMTAVEAAICGAQFGDHVIAYSHLSHVYPQGSSVYTTLIFPRAADAETNLRRAHAFKRAASEAIVANGGTISHQHGVGTDHRLYVGAEKGELGLDAIRAVFRSFDPDGMMNPGKLA